MTDDDHQRVINELQQVIDDTQAMLTRFEETGMNEEMPADYDKLLTILDDAIKQQRKHTKMALG
ncbi:hypothetical protein ACTXK7_14505 [Vreelandella alkaliphila]|uniref:hypothetical protein n=1 Tax=Vreelandella alkaliphila TaxID=272774 RepID=UPI003FD84996